MRFWCFFHDIIEGGITENPKIFYVIPAFLILWAFGPALDLKKIIGPTGFSGNFFPKPNYYEYSEDRAVVLGDNIYIGMCYISVHLMRYIVRDDGAF